MKTILTALREQEKVVDEEASTIARALGGETVASAISPAEPAEPAEPAKPAEPGGSVVDPV